MYIDFIDTLRDIQGKMYPNIKQWYIEIKILRQEVENIRDETAELKVDARIFSKDSEASALTSQSWADEDLNIPVKKYTYNEAGDRIEYSIVTPEAYSAKHWAHEAHVRGSIEKWEAEAAQMTACSFSNEPMNEPVKVYTSNGDGTFTEHVLEYVFSALHYRQDTELLTAHKRWVESQIATTGQTIFGFQKNINHADVYINGVRQVEGHCYTRILKDLHFNEPLEAQDVVTVSGMEACTGSEFQTLKEETEFLHDEAQKFMWEAEASEMTAQSFVSEPIDVHVKIYTSNGDGTFNSTETNFYSALHWSIKMNFSQSYVSIVDTYHDLELVNVNDVKVAYVRGGFSINDGRHGVFIYNASKSGINNQGTIIYGWERQYDGPMNISWFPVIGDGIIDDTLEIKKAIVWDNEIYFPNNKYLISDEIVIESKKIVCNNTKFFASHSTGNAFLFTKMEQDQGVFGHMMVKWTDNDMDVEKVSFRIIDSCEATYEISSEGATTGLFLDPQYRVIKQNVFRINRFVDNTVGIFIHSHPNGYNSIENLFKGGVFVQNKQIYTTWFNNNVAGHIYLENSENKDNIFMYPHFEVYNNLNGEFLLFRIYGNETTIEPVFAEISNDNDIYGIVSGRGNILEIEMARNLVAYIRETPNNVSTIDITNADDIVINGLSKVVKNKSFTSEYVNRNEKATFTIENIDGDSIYFPVPDDGEDHEIIKYHTENGKYTRTESTRQMQIYDSILKLQSSLTNTELIVENEIDHTLLNREELTINDDTDHQTLTKIIQEISDGTRTNLQTKRRIRITEDPYTAEIIRDDISFDDTSDFSHLSNKEIKINDNEFTFMADKENLELSNPIFVYHLTKDTSFFETGTMKNEQTAEYIDISDNGDFTRIESDLLNIKSNAYEFKVTNQNGFMTDTNDTFNFDRYQTKIYDNVDSNTSTKTNSEIKDSTDSNNRTKLENTITDTIDTNTITKLMLKIFDNDESTTITKTTIVIHNPTDDFTLTADELIFTDGTDYTVINKLSETITDNIDTLKQDKKHLEIKDSADSTYITKTDIDISDALDGLHASKTILEISDSTDSNTLTKVQSTITDSVDTNESTKQHSKIYDSVDSSEVQKTFVEIKDATDSNTSTKLDITITDTVDTFKTSKTELSFKDSTDMAVLEKDNFIMKDSADQIFYTKTNLKINDAIDSNELTKTNAVITDGTDTTNISKTLLHIFDSDYTTEITNKLIHIKYSDFETNITYDNFEMKDLVDSIDFDRTHLEIKDAVDSFRIDKLSQSITDGSDTNYQTKTNIKIFDSTDSNELTKTSASITDGTDTNINTKIEQKISDSLYSNKSNKLLNEITDGTDYNLSTNSHNKIYDATYTNDATKTDITITDGTDTYVVDRYHTKISDAGYSNNTTKTDITLTDGTDTSNLDRTLLKINDATYTSELKKDVLNIFDATDSLSANRELLSITDSTNSLNANKTSLRIYDSVYSFNVTKLILTFDDGTDSSNLDRNQLVFSDGSNVSTLRKNILTFVDGSDKTDITAIDSTITDSVDTLKTTKLDLKIYDSDNSLIATKNSVSIHTQSGDFNVTDQELSFQTANSTHLINAEMSKITKPNYETTYYADKIENVGADGNTTITDNMIELVDGQDKTVINRHIILLDDGTTTNTVTNEDITITDGTKVLSADLDTVAIIDGSKSNTENINGAEIIDGSNSAEYKIDKASIIDASNSLNIISSTSTYIDLSTGASGTYGVTGSKVIDDSSNFVSTNPTSVVVHNDSSNYTATVQHNFIHFIDVNNDLEASYGYSQLSIKDNNGNIESTLTKNELIFTDPSISSVFGSAYLRINDGTDVSELTNTTLSITDTTDTFTVSKTTLSIDDGTNTLSATKGGLSISDASSTNSMNAGSISISDATNNIDIDSTSIEISNGIDNTEIGQNSIEVYTSPTSSAKIVDTSISITQNTAIGKLTAKKLDILDSGSDDSILLSIDAKSEIKTNNATNAALTLSNIDTTDDSYALAISDGTTDNLKIKNDGNFLVGEKKIIWKGNSAPLNGTFKVGDIVYNENPQEGDYIGWTCIVDGSPGTWIEFGKIEDKKTVLMHVESTSQPEINATGGTVFIANIGTDLWEVRSYDAIQSLSFRDVTASQDITSIDVKILKGLTSINNFVYPSATNKLANLATLTFGSDVDTSTISTMNDSFRGINVADLDISNFDLSNLTSADNCIIECPLLTNIKMPSNMNTVQPTASMNKIIADNPELLCITRIDTVNATDRTDIFSNCPKLTQPDSGAITDITDSDGASWVNSNACP